MSADTQSYLQPRETVGLPGRDLAWLQALRDRAAARFAESGLPSVKDEEWRYTNIKPIQRLRFSPSAPGAARIAAGDLEPFEIAGLKPRRVVVVDGHFQTDLSDLTDLPDGLTIKSLADAVTEDAGELETTLGRHMPEDSHGFTALNTVYIQDGVYLKVADHCRVAQPVHVLYVRSTAQTTTAQPRNLMVLGENSEVAVIEHFVSLHDGAYLTNAVTEIAVGRGAVLDHTKLQEEGASGHHVAGVFVSQARDSKVTSNNITLGGAIARTDLTVSLDGEHAHCVLNGLYVGGGKQHIDNFTHVNHVKPDCVSDENYRGVLDGRARGIFRGRIVVYQDAQHTDARQQNKNLLLSPDAEADTKPQLEIYADDVKCAHGATVGQLDEGEVFYLRSRGLDEATARNLLTYAFAREIIDRIGLAPLRDRLEHALTNKLFHVERLEELVQS